MKTKFIEFSNTQDQTLRGIITLPNGEIKKGVVCVHGFERSTTTEKKFKILANKLAENMIATLRFDFSGCGISDGDFRYTTIEEQSQELLTAISAFQSEIDIHKIEIVAHSLGGAILGNTIEKIQNQIDKILLIAPALNQKELLRYRFVTSQMKVKNPEKVITRENYRDYLNEQEFIKDCIRTDKTTKINHINSEYFMEAQKTDFSNTLDLHDKDILHIHGNRDQAVPVESLNTHFTNQMIIDNGDHDLEKPKQFEQWIDQAVDFLSK